MPHERHELTRAELPETFTAETVRRLPLSTLRRLADHRNGVLDQDDQRAFDAAIHEVMGDTAARVSRRLGNRDWAAVRRDADAGGRPTRRGATRADVQRQRIARRIGEQVDLAETLAPGVDWSFAQPADDEPNEKPIEAEPAPAEPPTDSANSADSTDDDTDDSTVSDLERRLNDQVEMVEVMTEIADVSKRTFALEQQRDLQTTRGVFFGFVVSLAVLVAGWAPLVAADDWDERVWILILTLATCVVAGAAYGLVRYWQTRHSDEA